MKMLTPLPHLYEVRQDHYGVTYRDEDGRRLPPHLVLRWDEDGGQWALEDGQGRAFLGETRRILARYLAEAFAQGLPPRVQQALGRIDEALVTRDRLGV